jgi:DNA gyrase subunit A
LRLQRLTGLERDKIAAELDEVVKEISHHLEVLRSRPKLLDIVRAELAAARAEFATPRRTVIEELEFEADIEALIQREDMVITVTHAGYIKRVPLSMYRAQRRGGRGRTGVAMREEDAVSEVFVASTLAPVLFFTSSGRVYKLKVYRLPVGTPQARGKAMVNLLTNLAPGETISTVMPMPEDETDWSGRFVVFATAKGNVRRNALEDFATVYASGKIAMKFEGEDADDRMIAAAICTEKNDILLATRHGRCIRFPVDDNLRVFTGRTSVGVRGIRLTESGDEVVSLSVLRHEDVLTELRYAYLLLSSERRREARGETAELEESDAENGNGVENGENGDHADAAATLTDEQYADLAQREEFILTITEKGFGRTTSAYHYRITARGGLGLQNISRRQGNTIAVFPVGETDQVMLVTDGGMVIRVPVRGISLRRRPTGGVRVIKVDDAERVVSAARFPEAEESVVGGASEGTEP